MAARRLIFVLIVMLMLSSFAAALVPVTNRDDEDTSTTTTAPEPEPRGGRGELVQARIAANAPKPKTIRIELGDQLALAVTSARAGEVEIPELGELEDVEPGTPARFDLLPMEAGAYDVRLVEPDRLLGRIVVAAPKKPAKQHSRKAAGKRGR